MKLILILLLSALTFSCAVDTEATAVSESVEETTDGLSRCITDDVRIAGVETSIRTLCRFDRNNSDPDDDIQSADLAYYAGQRYDQPVACHRVEVVGTVSQECYLGRGYYPGATTRLNKILVRDTDPADNRAMSHKRWTLSSGACSFRRVDVCSL